MTEKIMLNFDQPQQKMFKVTFCFPELVSARRKINSLHPFILEIKPILESHDLEGYALFWPRPPKDYYVNFFPNMGLMQEYTAANNIVVKDQVEEDSITKLSINSKSHIFGLFSLFFEVKQLHQKIRLCHVQLHMGF